MASDRPPALTNALYVHIGSGAFHILTWWISSYVLGCVFGLPTCGFLSVCGAASVLLVPVGLFEVGLAAWALQDPRAAHPWLVRLRWVEGGSILLGSVTGPLVALATQRACEQDDVVLYLHG